MTHRVAELVADGLAACGVDRIFNVPGESFLALLDALHDRPGIDLVTCRHEGNASLAAIADAKLTGRAGVLTASRGPGAFNAALGIHVAAQEAVPLVMLVGQVDRSDLDRGAVQEIDSRLSFGGLLKWSVRIHTAASVPEMLARAFQAAQSGTPGPVVVELPEDLLEDDATGLAPRLPAIPLAAPDPASIASAFAAIGAAERPIVLVGGECRTEAFRADLVRFSETLGLPVALANKMQDQFPNEHPNWIGQLGFFTAAAHRRIFDRADLIVAIGTRLGDLSSLGFANPRQSDPRQRLVHVYPDAEVLGARFETDIAIVSGAHAFVSAALNLASPSTLRPAWFGEVKTAREATHGWPAANVPAADVFGHTVQAIASRFEADGIVTTDSGNFAGWVHRIFSFRPSARLLGSACGAMGSGVPSGLAASLRYPKRRVIAFCGDGGFLMTGNELATAVARNANLVIVVSNNDSYGTIRTHQEREFPNRPNGTDLTNPDFAALAWAFGAKAFCITNAAEADAIVAEALSISGPVLIEVRSDVRQSPDRSVAAAAH